MSAFVLLLQIDQGGSGMPWWVWFVLISVLLLLLLIGLVRQLGLGEPLPWLAPRNAAFVAATEATVKEPAADSERHVNEMTEADAAPETSTGVGQLVEPGQKADDLEPATRDDLKRIEGVGPKIALLLNDNGIVTFADLAATETERLQQLLYEAGIRLAHPGTWPEQARLAAAGKWAELEIYQGSLKRGREK